MGEEKSADLGQKLESAIEWRDNPDDTRRIPIPPIPSRFHQYHLNSTGIISIPSVSSKFHRYHPHADGKKGG
jgi:hypothetical protein